MKVVVVLTDFLAKLINIFCINNDKCHVPTRTVSPALLFLERLCVNETGGFRGLLINCSCCLTSPSTWHFHYFTSKLKLCLRQDIFIGMENS